MPVYGFAPAAPAFVDLRDARVTAQRMGQQESSRMRTSSNDGVAALRAMGYTDEQAQVSLQATNGDVSRAVALLLDQMEPTSQPAARAAAPATRGGGGNDWELQRALEISRREAAAPNASQPTRASAAASAAEARFAQSRQQGLGSRAATSTAPAPQSTRAPPQTAGRAAAVARSQATATVPKGSASAPAEQRITACAARLSGRPMAVDTLITSLSRVLDHPDEEKYRKVSLTNRAFQERVASAPGGMEFLLAVGFEPMHGYLVLQSRDLALVWIGKSSLEQLRKGAAYQAAKEQLNLQQALNMSESEYEAEAAKRRAAFASRVPEEPAEGEAGNSLICFHVGEQQVWRRFESCNTLEDLVHYARSLPGAPLVGIELHNITMAPAVPLDLERELGLTLQRLELWPTGHLRVQAA